MAGWCALRESFDQQRNKQGSVVGDVDDDIDAHINSLSNDEPTSNTGDFLRRVDDSINSLDSDNRTGLELRAFPTTSFVPFADTTDNLRAAKAG